MTQAARESLDYATADSPRAPLHEAAKEPMAKTEPRAKRREIEEYEHKGKTRLNNPPVGLVTPETDKLNGRFVYEYDPHLDPQLVWAGKAERPSLEVPRVSLHVHERIDPSTIVRAVRATQGAARQMSLFEFTEENPPLREAIEFYQHKHNWSNRLIAGDSLLVMNSLLQKEGMSGKVQMVYIDPPYGVDYASNFQPFVNKKDVREKDRDLSQEPEMIRAFRDTWLLGIHSYLAYLRDRLLLARDLLSESGSVFVQISDENVHHVRELLDEVFGSTNFVCIIRYRTRTMSLKTRLLDVQYDHIVWYAKDKSRVKFRRLFVPQDVEGDPNYKWVQLRSGKRRIMTADERANHSALPEGSRVYRLHYLKPTQYRPNQDFNFSFDGKVFPPPGGTKDDTPDGVHSWATTREGMQRLASSGRLQVSGSTLEYVLFHDDYPVTQLHSVWTDTAAPMDKMYVVQTSASVIERCVLMATDPGDLVLDPTCGSGTTAVVAERWGRRWVTCDTSRVATTIARQRLMTAIFPYFELAHPAEGVDSGFKYESASHITLSSIANNEPANQETLYDSPLEDDSRVRVTGPFTVEALPAPTVHAVDSNQSKLKGGSDSSVARAGETLRESDWIAELLKTGIRGRRGDRLEFNSVEPLPAHRWLHAEGQAKGQSGERTVFSFGPEFAPLEPRQVASALQEAQRLIPRPSIVVFAAFQFDPQAAKDIDETDWPSVTILKAQMNPDLFTGDLKKQRSSNESFWLVGQPDARLTVVKEGKDKGKHVVELKGFDYYDVVKGVTESGGPERIAMWFLDTDYDGRSIFPRQAFFPMAGDKQGWSKLSASLRAEIDESKAMALRGTKSLPFDPGASKTVAVKIIDDRGIESLRVLEVR